MIIVQTIVSGLHCLLLNWLVLLKIHFILDWLTSNVSIWNMSVMVIPTHSQVWFDLILCWSFWYMRNLFLTLLSICCNITNTLWKLLHYTCMYIMRRTSHRFTLLLHNVFVLYINTLSYNDIFMYIEYSVNRL